MTKDEGEYAVLLLDEYGNIESQNKGAEKIKGYLPGKMIGENISVFYTKEDREKGLPEKLIQEAIANGEAIHEGWCVRKDGTKFWCHVTLTSLYNKAGGLTGFSKVTRDVSTGNTKTIYKQGSIIRSNTTGDEFDQNNMYALINNTHDLMWSVDRNYKLITSNNAFDEQLRHMTGSSILKGNDVFPKGITTAQVVRYKILYERAFSGETFKVIDYVDVPVPIWSELSFYPIHKGSEIAGTACYSHNITEQKIANEKIMNTQRLYAFISHINQAISHAKNEHTLFEAVCHVAINIGKYDLAWIGIPDNINKRLRSPFNEKTTYFAPSTKDFMINYRVENLVALISQLRNGGVEITDTMETFEYGKFIHIMDIEGNKIELWEPNDDFKGSESGTTK